jgi:hypothetical protein
MSSRELPSHISQLILTDYRAKPESVVYAAFNQSQLDGSRPYVVRRVVRTSANLDVLTLVPEHLEVSRRVSSSCTDYLLACGDRVSVLLSHTKEQVLEIHVSSDDYKHAASILNQMKSRIPETKPMAAHLAGRHGRLDPADRRRAPGRCGAVVARRADCC